MSRSSFSAGTSEHGFLLVTRTTYPRGARNLYFITQKVRTIFNQVSAIEPGSYQLMPNAKMLGYPKIRILTSRIHISRA
jgi:hypothetical protein